MDEISVSRQLLLEQRKKLNKHDLHTFTSKPIKTSRSEGVDLLRSTEILFSHNSVAPLLN